MRASFERALDRLRAAGGRVDRVVIPHVADAPAIYVPLCLAEAGALHARTLEAVPEAYTEPVRLRLELGRTVAAEDYVRARQGQEMLRREVEAALADVDVLVLPTMAIVAPPIGAATVPLEPGDEPVRTAMLRLTQPVQPQWPPGDVPADRALAGRLTHRPSTGRARHVPIARHRERGRTSPAPLTLALPASGERGSSLET